jgi:iron complex outermembrane receptor protein
MLYGSVSTGFKGGGTNPRPFFASQAIGFDPEELTNFEAGFKSDLFGRVLRLNATAFYGILKNAQLGTSICPGANPTPCAALVNGGDAEQKGFEVESSLRPVRGLSIDGTLSYIDFKYTRLAPGSTIALTDPRAGLPAWKWSLGAQYQIDLGSLGSLSPRLDAAFQDKVYSGSQYLGVPQYVDGYTLMNARLTWQNPDRDLSVALEVTNLTDKYYYVTLFDLRAAGAGLDKAQPGRPREWAVTVKKTF